MGQLLEAVTSANNASANNAKHAPIASELYCTRWSCEAGSVVTRSSDGVCCFMLHKELQQSAVSNEQERKLKQWLGHNYSHSCNIIQYQIRSRSLLCNAQVTLKVLLEYGTTLHAMLHTDSATLDRSQLTCGQEAVRFQSPVERMGFVKTMLDAAEEQHQKNGQWVTFHTKNLVYYPKEKAFRLFFLLSLQESSLAESFFAPEAEAGKPPNEAGCVFSMGMVLLSLFLGEDSSDCYNYQNYTFCESIFEDKVERLRQKLVTRGLLGIMEDQSRYVPHFQEEVNELILLMIAPKQERLCFVEVKRRYLCLIRTLSYASSEHHTRSILQPLTSKRVPRRTHVTPNHPNIGCFSTHEDLRFRTTITQADQSHFFAFSKSTIRAKPIQANSRSKESASFVSRSRETCSLAKECSQVRESLSKGRDNQALRWKRAIINRMRQHKENIPFYQQN